MGIKRWKVVGGSDKGGILVRQGRDLSSTALPERLGTGAIVEQEQLEDERLCFRKVSGSGPSQGWVSLRLKDKELVVPHDEAPAEAVEPEAAAEDAPATTGGPMPGSFSGEGRTLGSSDTASAPSAETPQERRLRALQAAERRQANVSGSVTERRRARWQEQLDAARKEAAAADAAPAPKDAGQAAQEEERLRRQREEEEREQERQREKERQRQRQREEEMERARRQKAEEERRQGLIWAEEAEEEERQRKKQERRQQAAEQNMRRRQQRNVPRSQLMCASPGCHLAVHSRPEMGGYCCIACSEGGEHGPRCEQIMAPAGAVKADRQWATMGGDQMEDMELEEALRESMLDFAGGPRQGQGPVDDPIALMLRSGQAAGAGATGNAGKTQEELDLEEAMRLSMLDAGLPEGTAGGQPQDARDAPDQEALDLEEALRQSRMMGNTSEPVKDAADELDDEALELEQALRLSREMNNPEEPVKEEGQAAGGAPGHAGSDPAEDDDDDSDDEIPDLVPIPRRR